MLTDDKKNRKTIKFYVSMITLKKNSTNFLAFSQDFNLNSFFKFEENEIMTHENRTKKFE